MYHGWRKLGNSYSSKRIAVLLGALAGISVGKILIGIILPGLVLTGIFGDLRHPAMFVTAFCGTLLRDNSCPLS